MSPANYFRSQLPQRVTRRNFFERFSDGICGAALATLFARDLFGAKPDSSDGLPEGHRRIYDLKPRTPHFAPKAKAVIHLFMNGGPSQMDLFDPKPVLDKRHGQPYFSKIAGEVENPRAAGALMRSPFKFARQGRCGMWVSDALPHLATQVDDIALIRSLYTTN